MTGTLKHVFQFGAAWWNYYQAHKDTLRPAVLDNMVKMLSCAQRVRGAACYTCPNPACTHIKYVPFTCKGRFCPTCGKKATAQWVHTQQAILPNTPYQHITFTMPKTLWRLFQLNRQLLHSLSPLAAQTIQQFAQQKGVIPGIFTALHTFGRDLKWNTHIHLSTTRGGLTHDHTQWKSLFFKKEPLMKMWRYRVIQCLRLTYQNKTLQLPKSLQALCPNQTSWNLWLDRRYQQRWIIHCAKPKPNFTHSLHYLGSYIKRPPIAQSRILHYDGRIVLFRYFDHRTKQHKQRTCTASEFIQRFTQHIPDKGFRMIRYYGLLANRVRGQLLPLVYKLIKQTQRITYPLRWAKLSLRELGFDPLRCLLCQTPLKIALIWVGKSTAQLHKHHQALALMKPIF